MSIKLLRIAFVFTLFVFATGLTFGFAESVVEGRTVDASIDKKVSRPGTSDYTDNLYESDAHYKPGEIVNFKIYVKNLGDVAIHSVKVKDVFPQYVNFHSSPSGGNHEKGVWTIDAGTLNPGDSRDYLVSGQVVSADQIPSGYQLYCVNNRAEMHGDVSGSLLVTDSAQFCVEKAGETKGMTTIITKGAVPVQLPSAGAGSIALVTLVAAGAGLVLRRLSK